MESEHLRHCGGGVFYGTTKSWKILWEPKETITKYLASKKARQKMTLKRRTESSPSSIILTATPATRKQKINSRKQLKHTKCFQTTRNVPFTISTALQDSTEWQAAETADSRATAMHSMTSAICSAAWAADSATSSKTCSTAEAQWVAEAAADGARQTRQRDKASAMIWTFRSAMQCTEQKQI